MIPFLSVLSLPLFMIIHLIGLAGIENQLRMKLRANNLVAGDDMVVMVVNEGEIDLYLNFACSCQQHSITLHNLIVFSGSRLVSIMNLLLCLHSYLLNLLTSFSEIVPLIEATGALALYHEGYGAVSKKASTDYLDRTFVDMMWYKAFSVHLILREGINIVFQDADLVWFRKPWIYFRTYIEKNKKRSEMTGAHPEAFFSDDGQRFF